MSEQIPQEKKVKTGIECPKCHAILEDEPDVEFHEDKFGDYYEVVFHCPNRHEWFYRISEGDLLEG